MRSLSTLLLPNISLAKIGFEIRECSIFVVQVLIKDGLLHRVQSRTFRRKMSIDIRVQPLNTAFKHWQNLAVGTVLMAFSAYITYTARSFVTTTTTELQGWAMLIIAGYAFVSALYLGLSTLSEHSPLPETLPRIVDNFKGFTVAGIFYAVGYFLLEIETRALPASQSLFQGFSFIIGGAFFLVATIVGIAAAFRQPKSKDSMPKD